MVNLETANINLRNIKWVPPCLYCFMQTVLGDKIAGNLQNITFQKGVSCTCLHNCW